jgi:TnpA family transposase
MSTRLEVLARVERFLAQTGMSERKFGLDAVADHRFVAKLRNGAGTTLRTIERAEQFIERSGEPTRLAG